MLALWGQRRRVYTSKLVPTGNQAVQDAREGLSQNSHMRTGR